MLLPFFVFKTPLYNQSIKKLNSGGTTQANKQIFIIFSCLSYFQVIINDFDVF
jgi:hypothetical protein